MALDFRASQFRGAKFIASGSTGTGASLVFYPIAADSTTNPNTGVIDSTKFGTGSIGTDVFLFVSGGISQKGSANSHAISVFGGDLHVSGNLTIGGSGGGTNYWTSTASNVIFTTGSVLISGTLTLATSSIVSQSQYITINSVSFAYAPYSNPYQHNLTILAGGVISGTLTGGKLRLVGGQGGYVTGSGDYGFGGPVEIYGGRGGDTHDTFGLNQGSLGGDVTIQAGAAGTILSGSTRTGGQGGNLTLNGGIGSDNYRLNGAGGTGGGLNIAGGTGGTSYASASGAGSGGGVGGTVLIYGGQGGASFVAGATGSNGGSLTIKGGPGGELISGTTGQGGDVLIQGGLAGFWDIAGTAARGGNVTIAVGDSQIDVAGNYPKVADMSLSAASIPRVNHYTSGSFLQIGSNFPGATASGFARIFFNAPMTSDLALFPGTDIFSYFSGSIRSKNALSGGMVVFGGDTLVSGVFYAVTQSIFGTPLATIPSDVSVFISGTQNKAPSGPGQKNFVVSADMVLSGCLLVRSSSTNPINFLINGNGDGGIIFSGSQVDISTPGGHSVGNFGGAGLALLQQDVYFFVSGAIGGKGGTSKKIAAVGGDFVVSGNFYGLNSASFSSTVIVPTPTTGTAAANKDYVDYPGVRVVTGSTDTLLATDIGNIVAYTITGALLITLTGSLSGSIPANRGGVIMLQFEHSASAPVISSSGGATLNSFTIPYTGSIGAGLLSISSRNGLNWFR